MKYFGSFLCAVLSACASPAPQATPTSTPAQVQAPPAAAVDPIEQLVSDAQALMPMMQSELGRGFLNATKQLQVPAARELFYDAESQRMYTSAELEQLAADKRSHVVKASELEMREFFYNTYHGTPLAYARALDLLGSAGVTAGQGKRLADFGFGNIGQLRLLASLGFETVGIDVATFLAELYSAPSDQGPYGDGSVKMVIGRFPVEPAVVEAVGTGLDVFISKNTLKRGYIHPYRTPGKPNWVIDLGVSDEVFLRVIHDALKPGGKFMIYNICPALTPEDQPFVTWSDGRSPFSREQFAAAGFDVLAFEVDDAAFVREMGHKLRWDEGEESFDLVNDLSVLYTLVERQ